jgi:hypothetical protein
MDTSLQRTDGLRVMVNLNLDWVVYVLTLAVALMVGTWLGSVVFS